MLNYPPRSRKKHEFYTRIKNDLFTMFLHTKTSMYIFIENWSNKKTTVHNLLQILAYINVWKKIMLCLLLSDKRFGKQQKGWNVFNFSNESTIRFFVFQLKNKEKRTHSRNKRYICLFQLFKQVPCTILFFFHFLLPFSSLFYFYCLTLKWYNPKLMLDIL